MSEAAQGFVGKFHTHTTLAYAMDLHRARAAVHGAVSEVVLDDHQVDPILTHHYVTGYRMVTNHFDILGQLSSQVSILKNLGIEVARAKLEAEFDDSRSPTEQRDAIVATATYVEAHLKTEANVPLLGWARSRDWQGGAKSYYTRRWQNTTLAQIRLDVDAALMQFELPVTAKIEAVLYDSDPEHDSWWA